MRELTVRIRFTRHCLGAVRDQRTSDGRYVFHRNQDGQVLFRPVWHRQNMRLAAALLGRYQSEVDKICWDLAVDCVLRQDPWHKRHLSGQKRIGNRRFAFHEAFFPDQIVGLNCVVPFSIPDDAFLQLMRISGKYKGLSPWEPGEYGHFEVESIRPRRPYTAPVPELSLDERTNQVIANEQSSARDPAGGTTG